MNADRLGALITILGSMALVGSALIVRRGQWRTSAGWMAPVWVAIFALMIAVGLWLDRHS